MQKKVFLCLLPLLASCSGNNPSQVIYHKITFSGDEHCYMYDVVEPYGQVTEKEWEENSVVNYVIKPIEGYKIPASEQVSFLTNDGKLFEGYHSYDPITGNLSVKMSEDVIVKASTSTVNYKITFSGDEHCHMYDVVEPYEQVDERYFEIGSIAIFAIKPVDGYLQPKENQVIFLDKEGDPFEGDYSYDYATGEISVKMSEDVTIQASATKGVPLSFNAAFCELEGNKSLYEEDEEVNINIAADDVLTLPETISVKIGGEDATLGEDYTYTKSGDNKTATFHMDKITEETMVSMGVNEASEPLTFEALSDNATLNLFIDYETERSMPLTLEYSLDKTTWIPLDIPNENISVTIGKVTKGNKIYLRGDNPKGINIAEETGNETVYSFETPDTPDEENQFSVSGNIMSIISRDNYSTMDSIKGLDYCFYSLFCMVAEGIIDTSNLLLPKTLAPYCFSEMFYYCDYMTTAPRLRAKTLEDGCYELMFGSCSELEIVEESTSATEFLTCPSLYGLFYSVKSMFAETKGHEQDEEYQPISGHTYYYVNQQ